MTFKLEFIRDGYATLWKGVVDEERNSYMCHAFGSSIESYRRYELNYQGFPIIIEIDENEKEINKETGESIKYELGKLPPPMAHVAIVKIISIKKPATCVLNQKEIESLAIEAFKAQGYASLKRESDGGAEVSFHPDYEFLVVENNRKEAKSPEEVRQELARKKSMERN